MAPFSLLRKRSPTIVINDIDAGLINTYRVIRDNPEGLIDRLRDITPSKEVHSFLKKEFKPRDYLDEAFRWFFLNRISYSGIMKMSNCYWGYNPKYSMPPEKWASIVLSASEKLRGVDILNTHFHSVISQAPDNSFLFIDPPYFTQKQKQLYTHSFTEEDHVELSALLKEHTHRFCFLLTYNDCPEVRSLYSWVSGATKEEWNYTVGRSDMSQLNRRPKGKELLLYNYRITL